MMEGSFLSIQTDSDETEWKFYAKFLYNFWGADKFLDPE